MKNIDLYVLRGDPENVYQPLGYNARLDGFDAEVTSSAALRELEWFPTNDHQQINAALPLTMHSVLEWTGVGQKDILCAAPSLWTVVSQRMLSALKNLGPFEHQTFPVRIWDELIKPGEDPKSLPSRHNDEYLLLYLPNSLKVFSYRDSDYEFITGEYGRPTGLKQRTEATEQELHSLEQRPAVVMPSRIVLNTREDQLPPVFRLAAMPNSIYVTASAAQHIARSGLTNVWLQPNLEPVFCQDDVLARLQRKYPAFDLGHEPTPDCPWCGGRGEETGRDPVDGHRWTSPCFCTFAQDRRFTLMAQGPSRTLNWVLLDTHQLDALEAEAGAQPLDA